jgi:endonuclease YncB( thermonuclease family)
MKHCFLAVIALLAVNGTAVAAERRSLEMRVVSITDGDTITARDALNTQHKVRLAGIDSPEAEQPFGSRSKQHLSQLLQNKAVLIEWSKTDRYGRLIATVRVPGAGACAAPPCPPVVDVSLAQLRAGMAWHDKEFEKEQTPRERREYAAAEQQARAGKTGLWADKNPVAPSEWRRGLTSGPVKKSRNNICHEPSSTSYKATTDFESFATIEACLASGGRRPGNP